MTFLEEKEPAPSLALITTAVAIVAAVAFGGLWAMNHAASAASETVTQQSAPAAPVEGNI
jgi:hypothetical protein